MTDFPIQLKYKNYPSIIAIRNANNNSHFQFNEVSVEVYKEIRKLRRRKFTQITDIPIRVPTSADIFADYICGFSREPIKKSTFPFILKNPNITLIFEKDTEALKRTIANITL